jgi:hypothetical protein
METGIWLKLSATLFLFRNLVQVNVMFRDNYGRNVLGILLRTIASI